MSFWSALIGRKRDNNKSKGVKMVKKIETATHKVLDTIASMEGFFLNEKDIAMFTGISEQRVTELIASFILSGIVQEERLSDNASIYILNYSPNVEKHEQDELIGDYCESVEDDVWQFFKDTRSTDILMFLTWMERKYGRV